ncbi:MAG: carbohydrate ABC transporter permease [Bacillota bacterium]
MKQPVAKAVAETNPINRLTGNVNTLGIILLSLGILFLITGAVIIPVTDSIWSSVVKAFLTFSGIVLIVIGVRKYSKRKTVTLEGRRSRAGRIFVYPWVIGFIFFVLRPLVQSICFTFNSMEITDTGFSLSWRGFDHYMRAFTSDDRFPRYVLQALSSVSLELPLIVLFSLFMAVLLNQKFKGRVFIRGAFFLPVVITSGALVYVLQGDLVNGQLTGQAASSALPMVSNLDFSRVLNIIFANMTWVRPFIDVMDRVYIVIWRSGVQILIFLAGLQSISPELYESSDVEGATAWEAFWKITIPMISPIIVLNVIYTVIDSFTDWNNPVLRYIINDVAFGGQLDYCYASALSWIYFGIVLTFLGIILAVLSRKTFYIND